MSNNKKGNTIACKIIEYVILLEANRDFFLIFHWNENLELYNSINKNKSVLQKLIHEQAIYTLARNRAILKHI